MVTSWATAFAAANKVRIHKALTVLYGGLMDLARTKTTPLSVIINPEAGRGMAWRFRSKWKTALIEAFGPIQWQPTKAPGHGAHLVRQALGSGRTDILVIGGDGTVHDVVNGFFEDGRAIAPDAELMVLMDGTGSDLARGRAAPAITPAAIRKLANAEPRRADVGRCRFPEGERYFLNMATWGLSSKAGDAANRWLLPRGLGGKLVYLLPSLVLGLGHKNLSLKISCDGAEPEQTIVHTISICNGPYMGGGMHMAPGAALTSGQFDVVTVGDANAWDTATQLPRLYRGTHLNHPKVTHRHASTITIDAVSGQDRTPLNLDGEIHGSLPVTIECLPGALRLRM